MDVSWHCQVGNNYHLLIETLDGDLSKGMRRLNGLYTEKFNRRHTSVGPVYQARFKSIIVDKDSNLFELCR